MHKKELMILEIDRSLRSDENLAKDILEKYFDQGFDLILFFRDNCIEVVIDEYYIFNTLATIFHLSSIEDSIPFFSFILYSIQRDDFEYLLNLNFNCEIHKLSEVK